MGREALTGAGTAREILTALLSSELPDPLFDNVVVGVMDATSLTESEGEIYLEDGTVAAITVRILRIGGDAN